jgi:hypothetical protein
MMENELIDAVEKAIRYVERQLMISSNRELERWLNDLYNLKWEIQKVRDDC